MAKGGKRAGAGRPRGRRSNKVQLLVRIAPEVREAIDREAKRSGKSVSAQTEAVLIEAASAKSQTDRRAKATGYLVTALCEALKAAERAGEVDFDWRNSRFDFEALRFAIQHLLERLAPAGEIEPGRYPAYETPADLGRTVAEIVFMLAQAERAQMYATGSRRGAASGSLFFAFPQVADALGLK